MMNPLNGSRLKVVRAQEHLDELADEVARYLQSDPYEAVMSRKHDMVRVLPRFTAPPPVRLSAIVGDCLGNLRSALDYIIWGLATKYVGRPMTPPPIGHDKPYFPIFNSAEGFFKNLERLTKYSIPAAALGELQCVQPYNRRYEALWLLHLLVNEDKHRLPILTLADFSNAAVELTRGNFSHSFPVSPGGFITTLPASSLNEDEVNAHCEMNVFVTWNDATMPREPINVTLEKVIKCIANIVPRFDQFFSDQDA